MYDCLVTVAIYHTAGKLAVTMFGKSERIKIMEKNIVW